MSYLMATPAKDLIVGDIIHVIGGGGMIFANQKVIEINPVDNFIGTKATDDGEPEGFAYKGTHYTYYLIERPKQPLPKSIGSVVEVDGVKYVRVTEDSEWYYEWVKSEDTDQFDSISTECLSDLNYTVV